MLWCDHHCLQNFLVIPNLVPMKHEFPISLLFQDPPYYHATFCLYDLDYHGDLIEMEPFSICPFRGWLISLNIMPQDSLVCVRSSFLFWAELYSIVCTHHVFCSSTHQLMDAQVGPTFWLLRTTLLQTGLPRHLLKPLLSILSARLPILCRCSP